MKTKNKPHVLIMMAIVALSAAAIWSCNKDEDPSLKELTADKLQYLQDSIRISDSLKRVNAAGVVNYAISIVNGSTSTIFSNGVGPGREKNVQNVVDAAIVTISQYGKTVSDTTDATGLVVFEGFFRTSVTVTVQKAGFTTVSYISAVSITQSTANASISFVGNVIPIFETAGANTATISGRATIHTNLTNKTRELVPDGTKVIASINAKDVTFGQKFLTTSIDNVHTATSGCGCEVITIGEILQASYQSGVIGAVTGGNYSLTVPSAIDGLPIVIDYSEIAADQTLFESLTTSGQRTVQHRTIFQPVTAAATLPASSSVGITFETHSIPATATATIANSNGAISAIEVTLGGAGYTVAPIVDIQSTTGSGATATANIANGAVTSIAIITGGSGYVAATTTVVLRSGTGATASTTLAADGTITGIVMGNSGFGYTGAPVVTIGAPPLGTQATATATIDAAGRVTISMTNFGSGYTAPTAVTIGPPPAGGVPATATAVFSGNSVGAVDLTANGQFYSAVSPPTVTFSLPERANGTRATGTAQVDATTGQVTRIVVSNAGSGYTAAPTVAIQSVITVATAVEIISGGAVTSVDITNPGADYTGAPNVIFTKTTTGDIGGATGTAIIVNNRVVGVTITNGGGYTTAPTVSFSAGDGAFAFATVTNGSISAITVTDGGRNFTGAPRVVITSAEGSGATATATVANGQVTGVSVPAGPNGSGYLDGNTPAGPEGFAATKGTALIAKPGITYINDLYYGTGTIRQPN